MMQKRFFIFSLLALSLYLFPIDNFILASQTNGTIDATSKYAWGENIGWINFGCDNCQVQITDTALIGQTWSSNFGWIILNPTTSGVKNNGEGILSGDAWSPNIGWIDFTGVTINSSGEFLGYATLTSDNSQINFNCINANSCSGADFKVKTDWIPASARSRGGGGGGYLPPHLLPPPPPILPPSPTLPPVSVPPPTPPGPVANLINNIADYFIKLFNPKPIVPVNLVQVPKVAPSSLSTLWNLLPVEAIRSFVFAPLPYEIRILASKFPELDKTLKDVGINRFSDMNKLAGVTLNIPGLADTLNKTINNVGIQNITEINKLNGVGLNVPGLSNPSGQFINSVGTGRIALISGLPVAKFSLTAKNNLPAEFVFARASGELVDLNVALSVGNTGQVTQRLSTLPGETLRLVVKPISKAKSVTGYIVFKSATPKIAENSILRSSLTASALFSMGGLVQNIPTATVPVEKKLVLSSFEYLDPDGDGIYTADVVTPSVPAEYEIISVIDYIDPVLGSRRMTMIAVVDPEGYVFEKNNGKETRIPSAIVSLYHLNTVTKKYELWPAKDYQQENPQITDIRGTYSFLVPQGSYYFQVEAPGYQAYQGKVFVVVEGSGIHQNIELNGAGNWFSDLDWKTMLLIVVFLLLVYNLYRNRQRDELLKISNK